MKQKSIPDIARDLAKTTVKGMTAQERKEWEEVFADFDPKTTRSMK